jgi:hypothetical protein
MKKKFRLFRRNGVYYTHNQETGKQHSLKTKDRGEAQELLRAHNQDARDKTLHERVAYVLLSHSDSESATRTWEAVMTAAGLTKQGVTKARWERAMRQKPFDSIRTRPVLVAAGALYPFFGILLSPIIASAAMIFSSVSVIANALHLRAVRLRGIESEGFVHWQTLTMRGHKGVKISVNSVFFC